VGPRFWFYDVLDGQRFAAQVPVADEVLGPEEWKQVGPVVRHELTKIVRAHGLPFVDDPVVLCWRHLPLSERSAQERPLLWLAWGAPGFLPAAAALTLDGVVDRAPSWLSWQPSGVALALVVSWSWGRKAQLAWPDPDWWHEWHPTAKARAAARSNGITAVLKDGPFQGRTFKVSAAMTPRLQTPPAGAGPPCTYLRDPEPEGIAPDGSALWGYRSAWPVR
jgi:hypothetical protein